MEELNKQPQNVFLDRIIPGKYAQISSRPNYRYLVSLGEDLRIYRLGLFGLFNKVIYKFDSDFVSKISKIGVDPVSFVTFYLTERPALWDDNVVIVCEKIKKDFIKNN